MGNGENMNDGDVRNPDSEPEEEDEEKGVEGEFGKVEVLDTEREKATDLDFQHCKIPKIENMENLPALERLGFRWNFIKTIENVSHLTTLQELGLYDNQIKKLENLSGLVNLKMLDVSHNMLRRIEGLEGLANLETTRSERSKTWRT